MIWAACSALTIATCRRHSEHHVKEDRCSWLLHDTMFSSVSMVTSAVLMIRLRFKVSPESTGNPSVCGLWGPLPLQLRRFPSRIVRIGPSGTVPQAFPLLVPIAHTPWKSLGPAEFFLKAL